MGEKKWVAGVEEEKPASKCDWSFIGEEKVGGTAILE